MTQPEGLCFKYAAEKAARDGGQVVHGRCLYPPDVLRRAPWLCGQRHDYAWIERDGFVYDWQSRDLPLSSVEGFYLDREQVEVQRYEPAEAVALAVRTGTWGPWSGDEVAAQRASRLLSRGRRRP